MESGLEDRNNPSVPLAEGEEDRVSMESGLEDRNNIAGTARAYGLTVSVSMESGLEDRNNPDQSGSGLIP